MAADGLPYGDPCPCCGAGSLLPDERDRACVCTPCAVCRAATLSVCGYCHRSLGCPDHRVSIERHVETFCLASADDRARIDLGDDGGTLDEVVRAIRELAPKPWPAPVGPFERVRRHRVAVFPSSPPTVEGRDG